MRVLRTAGGLLLLGALIVVVFSGLNGTNDAVPIREAGQSFVSALWDSGTDQIGDGALKTGLAGNATAAFGVAAVVVLAALMLLPFARAGRAFAILIGLGVALGMVLYSPGLLGQVSGA